MSTPEIEIYVSCGNVFADLGLADADELLLRSSLIIELRRLMEARKVTQTAAAKLVGIGQGDFSKLLKGNLRLYTAERLMRMLTAFDQDIEITVKPHANAGEGGRITFHPVTA